MQLIFVETIICNYTPTILWLQDDEQIRTDSGVKVEGFLLMMQKFNTYFYVEVLRMVFSFVESVSAQWQIAQLNFGKALDIFARTKAFITSAKNDTRFDGVWSEIWKF